MQHHATVENIFYAINSQVAIVLRLLVTAIKTVFKTEGVFPVLSVASVIQSNLKKFQYISLKCLIQFQLLQARVAQSVERTTLNRVVGGSSPPMGEINLLRSGVDTTH